MAIIHELVARHGRDGARKLVSDDERHLVDIAAQILEEESQALGITYSGFCMTSLPHKRLSDDMLWQRKAPRFSLLIEPGHFRINQEIRQIGVPYGSRARLILLYLQTRAIQTDSSEVELGRSLHSWIERMGIPVGGKSYEQVREQANRISACKLTFFWEDDTREGFQKDNIVKGGIRLKSASEARVARIQGSLWEEKVQLGDTFFRALKAHPVPLWEPALRHIANQSMTIDVYIWLAYRLHSLERSTAITWTALHAQFGAGYKAVRQFKPRFIEALRIALAVYPDARVQIDEAKGLVLHPSRPPIGERKIALKTVEPLRTGPRVAANAGLLRHFDLEIEAKPAEPAPDPAQINEAKRIAVQTSQPRIGKGKVDGSKITEPFRIGSRLAGKTGLLRQVSLDEPATPAPISAEALAARITAHTLDKLLAEFSGLDLETMLVQWSTWAAGQGQPCRAPTAAFRAFLKRKATEQEATYATTLFSDSGDRATAPDLEGLSAIARRALIWLKGQTYHVRKRWLDRAIALGHNPGKAAAAVHNIHHWVHAIAEELETTGVI